MNVTVNWGGFVAAGLAAAAVCVLVPPAGRRARRMSHRDPGPASDQAAQAADLLAALLAAGQPPVLAIPAASAVLPEPMRGWLGTVAASHRAGLAVVSHEQSADPAVRLERLLRRSGESGSKLAGQLTALADELRAEHAATQLRQARRVGVWAALPLGVCSLPAFVLLTVVPVVIGLGRGLAH